jgi:NTP pyrophosphatase (non-canonical NTP hydrolase)
VPLEAYIRWNLSDEELLAQLAEEASELAQAALKLRRVLNGSNPARCDRKTAVAHIIEEISDVRLILKLLQLEPDPQIMDEKLHRWVKGLRRKYEAENND